MLFIYEAVFYPEEEGGYSVIFPDFGQGTCGEDIKDATEMAADWLETKIGFNLAVDFAIPEPTYGNQGENGERVAVIAVHIDKDEVVEYWGWVSTKRAAKELRCTPGHVRNLALQGVLRSRKKGRDLEIFYRDVLKREAENVKPGPKPRRELAAA